LSCSTCFCGMARHTPWSLLFPYTSLFRSFGIGIALELVSFPDQFIFQLGIVFNNAVMNHGEFATCRHMGVSVSIAGFTMGGPSRSEEHTSELQSRENLVCRLLLEKKNI